MVDAVGNPSYQAFDSYFNLTQTTDAAGRSYIFTYDGNGNLAQLILLETPLSSPTPAPSTS